MQVYMCVCVFSSFHYYAKSVVLCNSVLCTVHIWVNSVDAILKLPLLSSVVSLVQLLSHVRLFVTPRTVVCQASLSVTSSQSFLGLMSIEPVMPSKHLIVCHPRLLLPSIFPSIRVFSISQFFASGGQSNGVSASASVLPVNIPDWFPSNTNIMLIFSCHILNYWTAIIILTKLYIWHYRFFSLYSTGTFYFCFC